MILLRVEYSEYDDTIALHSVKEFIRKSLRDQAAETVVINRPLLGPFCKKTNCAFNLMQQIITQTQTS